MAGSGRAEPFMGGLILYNSAGTPSSGPITYTDSNSDAGMALSLGGGFDMQLRDKLGLRVAIDYDPTFLVRPVVHDPILDAGGRVVLPDTTLSERNRQDHLRATIASVDLPTSTRKIRKTSRQPHSPRVSSRTQRCSRPAPPAAERQRETAGT
jgi:hypothetical protein